MGWRGSRYEIIPDKNHTGRMMLTAGSHGNSYSHSHDSGTEHMPALNLRLKGQLITEDTYTDSNTAESPHTQSINSTHMGGTLLTGFTNRDSYCGLDGCYRLTVTANTSESAEVSRVHAATSFFEACGYRGASLCVCVLLYVCACYRL
jgi:hypothetical protein